MFSEKTSEAKEIKFEWVVALFHINLLTINPESLSSEHQWLQMPFLPFWAEVWVYTPIDLYLGEAEIDSGR